MGSPPSCLPIPHPERTGFPACGYRYSWSVVPRMLGDLPQFPDGGAEVCLDAVGLLEAIAE